MAHAERAFDEKGVFSGASGVRSDGSAMGNWSRRQPLIVFILGGGCTVGTGTSYEFPRRVRHGLAVKNSKNKRDGDVKFKR